ncbi:hypothetical protein MPDQ_005951 [Monascus purpureus]|uniref:Methyltransferase type 11 domain-containing protein n=1 Tax=Monascus purpureus TaxID=5098 RepID=A0A507QVV7_MONPU|nr:hypothetical protein MPDQ_005951 [Monascus purpureus]
MSTEHVNVNGHGHGHGNPANTKPSWYKQDVTEISPEAQWLLESYSKIQPDERDKAFNVYPYPCLGSMRFLSFKLPRVPVYDRILDLLRFKPSTHFLDVGCCVGQEVRYLASQGIPTRQLHGSDLERSFIDIGFQLFRDRDALAGNFVTGDLLAPSDVYHQCPLAKTLDGKIDIIWAGSLFHLWDYEDQVLVATRLVDLCREKGGVMIAGSQLGSLLGGRYVVDATRAHYRHNIETIKGFWCDVGERSGTRWTVEAGLFEQEDALEMSQTQAGGDENTRFIWWCATRERL